MKYIIIGNHVIDKYVSKNKFISLFFVQLYYISFSAKNLLTIRTFIWYNRTN